MPTDFSNRIPTIGGNAVTKAFSSVSYSNDTLRVAVPSNIIYPSRNDMVFACLALAKGSVFRVLLSITFGIDSLHGVPYAYRA